MAVELGTLDGDILHRARLDLVQQIGVANLSVLAGTGALLHHTPQQHEANEDKDPEHDRFNGRIHQDSSFPAGENPLEGVFNTACIITLDAATFLEVTESTQHLCGRYKPPVA